MTKKKFFLFSSFFLFMFAAAVLLFTDSDNHRDLPQIIKKKKLHIVTCNSPVCFYTDIDTTYGFQYELIKHFADSMGLELQIETENDLQKNIKDLKRGKYDIIARNIMITTELRKEINFSSPILYNRQILVQRADNECLIRNQLDLGGQTLYVTKGSPYALRIKNLAQEIGDTIHIKELDETDSDHIFELVANGAIEYAVCDQRIARLNKNPDLDIQTAIGFTQMEAWGLRKNSPELEKAINNFLESFLKTSTYQEIYNKYYDPE